ncbi:MAG: dethiobiotin synthase [Acidobacteriota bacterium]
MTLMIVGTDTEVGKTVVSALVCRRYADLAPPLTYWKPVASGTIEGRDSITVADLTAGRPVRIAPETSAHREPLSPHLAARLDGDRIARTRIHDAFRALRAADDAGPLVIEGVGGLLVPLSDAGDLLIDLIGELAAIEGPRFGCLLVARSTLGTINHSLLSLEALRRRNLPVAGVVLNGPPNDENQRAVARFGDAPVLGTVPRLNPLDAAALDRVAADWDPENRLVPWLSGGVRAG